MSRELALRHDFLCVLMCNLETLVPSDIADQVIARAKRYRTEDEIAELELKAKSRRLDEAGASTSR